MSAAPLVWQVALALPVALAVAWALAGLARRLLRSRVRLATSTAIVIAIIGCSVGLFTAGLVLPSVAVWSLLSVLCALGFTVAGIALYGAVAAHLQRPQRAPLPELLAAGESDRVEFKSTARVNLHTGLRDERMEQVIAKTTCAFLNADGGTLVIGVDDIGRPLGLDADLATLKSPDADRYELWLRDLLTTTLGQNAAALAHVEFGTLPGPDGDERLVCRVTCHPSPRPVYLRSGKSAAPELWVRSGNSTRHLAVDEATDYVMHRWPLGLGAGVAAQLRAAVRFSEGH